MSFFRNALGVLTTNVVGIPLALLTGVVVTRALSVPDRGLWAVAFNFAGLVALLSNLGWSMSSIYRLKRAGAEPARVVGTGLVANLAISGLVLMLGAVFQDPISARFLDGAPGQVFWLALLTVPLQLLIRLFSYVAKGIDRFAIRNWATLGAAAGRLTVLFVVLTALDRGLVAALLANLAVQLAVVLWLAVAIVRRTGLSLRVDRTELREGLRFGAKNYMQTLAGQLHEQVDVFILAALDQPAEAIALYAIAVGVLSHLKVVPEAIGVALFPRLAGSSAAEAGRFTAFVARHAFAWVLASSVAAGALAPWVVPLLYGPAYAASLPAFYVMLPAMGMLTVYRVLARYFVALDRQRVNIVSQSASVAVNVGLNLLLIPRHGIMGAAWASLASYTLEAVLITAAFRRSSGQRLADTFLFRPSELSVYRDRLRRWRRGGRPR